MGWLEDIQLNRRRQVEQMNKAFGNNLEKAYNKDDFSDDNSTKRDGKSNIYKMKVLGLRKFDGQDSKKYVGVENADGSYITNLDNGDIVVSLMDDGGYLVSKFPIGNDEDVDEREAADLDEALDIALMYKEDLEEETDDDDVMYQNTEKSDDDAEVYAEEETEKSFEDEVNPFELSAWEKEQEEIAKAYETLGLDYNIEKAHKDGDMHPNGKWVWRASANGGKGDWRVAKPGGSKATAGGGAAATTQKQDEKQSATKKPNLNNKNLSDLSDEEFKKVYDDAKTVYNQISANKNVNDISRKSAEEAMKKLEEEKKRRIDSSSSPTVYKPINKNSFEYKKEYARYDYSNDRFDVNVFAPVSGKYGSPASWSIEDKKTGQTWGDSHDTGGTSTWAMNKAIAKYNEVIKELNANSNKAKKK